MSKNSHENLGEAYDLATDVKLFATGHAPDNVTSSVSNSEAIIQHPAGREDDSSWGININRAGVLRAGIKVDQGVYSTGKVGSDRGRYSHPSFQHGDVTIKREGYKGTIKGDSERGRRAAEIITKKAAKSIGREVIERARTNADELEHRMRIAV